MLRDKAKGMSGEMPQLMRCMIFLVIAKYNKFDCDNDNYSCHKAVKSFVSLVLNDPVVF